VSPPSDNSQDVVKDVVIRDTIHEVLELVPTLPRLQRLSGMLRGREYDEGHEEDDEIDEDDGRSVSIRNAFLSICRLCSRIREEDSLTKVHGTCYKLVITNLLKVSGHGVY
jgi:hypothetical protein